jgi:hypothetical protein
MRRCWRWVVDDLRAGYRERVEDIDRRWDDGPPP